MKNLMITILFDEVETLCMVSVHDENGNALELDEMLELVHGQRYQVDDVVISFH